MKFLNKINKVSLLIGVSTLLLVGGVYATFSYSSNVVKPVTSESDGNNTIEDKFITDEGTITITKNDLAVSVKNKGNNVTTLDKLTGEVKATFKHSDQASEFTKNNGIYWSFRIDFENNTFNGQNILNTSSHSDIHEFVVLEQKKASKEFTFDPNEVDKKGNKVNDGLISVNEISLTTASDYDSYKEALKKVKIKVTLSRYTNTYLNG